MDPRIPAVLVPALDCYLSAVDQRLPGFLGALYVVGSIALDEFNPDFSDVDIVAGISRPAREDDIRILKEIHGEVERKYSRWQLEGMYLLESQLGGTVPSLVYHDGRLSLHPPEADPVTWWILRHRGIALRGPDPRDLSIPVDLDVLVAWTRRNMSTYWKSWTRQPGRLIRLWSDWGIQWSVLGVSRQLYTIREKAILSKRRAGEYALARVPAQWHPILREASRIRTKSGTRLYRSRLVRMIDAVNFMKYILQVSKENLE